MTLLMRDQENIEKGREEGRKGGRKEGIDGMVVTLKELDIPEDIILKKLQERFHVTIAEAHGYLKGL